MAVKIFHAVRKYLKGNLGLDISPEKSMMINLRRRVSEFLGFTLKAVKKKKRFVAYTHVMDKKKEAILKQGRNLIKKIQKNPCVQTVMAYNTYVLGIKNYYKIATHVNINFQEIAYLLSKTLYNRLKSIGKYGIPIKPNETYRRLHSLQRKTYEVCNIYLFPIADVQTQNNMNFSQDICNYTVEGRKMRHKKLKFQVSVEIHKMIKNTYHEDTLEYADNRISKYSCQKGKCLITGEFLFANEVHCHHILPKSQGGTDKFDNLIVVHDDVHRLIHATEEQTIRQYKNKLQLNVQQLKKVNKYRKICNLVELVE